MIANLHGNHLSSIRFEHLSSYFVIDFILERLTYLVQRLSVSEDKVDGSLDKAFLKVMATVLIIKSVLSSIERDAVESRHVSLDAECNSLPSDGTAEWGRGRILRHGRKNTGSENSGSKLKDHNENYHVSSSLY